MVPGSTARTLSTAERTLAKRNKGGSLGLLDPLRYGLRALDEMAREQASVAPPPRVASATFAPHPILRRSAPNGAALSLRLFSEAADDATAFVLGGATALRLDPVPPRAAALFEAHATVMATTEDDTMTLGFPLVTFVHQGASRAAPLFSLGGARARWRAGDQAWELPPGARDGAPMPAPTALELVLEDDATYAIHGGVWFTLFGLDGGAVARIGRASARGLGALVRAAAHALAAGGEADDGDDDDDTGDDGPVAAEVTSDDLGALCEAAARRAHASRGLRCFPHGLLMLPPRGDPTSALRTDLRALLDEPSPKRGPLAVYLGATPAASRPAPVWSCGSIAPTPSQLAAARALEGSSDLVAVCGPPGCGKTALLHVVAAQAVVACALGPVWREAPGRAAPWPLVVTSTNNAAVDHALAPFVLAPAVPLGLRLGSRRTLAEVTVGALAASLAALSGPAPKLADARAAFEALAKPVRARQKEHAAATKAREAREARRGAQEARAKELRALVARAAGKPPRNVPLPVVREAERALEEHLAASEKLVRLHLEGKKASVTRAREKWARANELRAPRILPALAALGLDVPFGPLVEDDPRADIARQHAALAATLAALAEARDLLAAPGAEDELRALAAELARPPAEEALAAPEPALYEAALALRAAWAREHHVELGRRLSAALAAAGEGRAKGRAKPLSHALHDLAVLFPIAGCTLLSMRTAFPLEDDVIDRLVVDEAAQCAPVYAAPALARAKRVMLTGDTAQLPPVYTLDPRTDRRLGEGLDAARIAPFGMAADAITSAQAVAEPRAGARLALVEHFRSQAPIVALASRFSGYTLDVRTAPRSLRDVSPRLAAAVVAVPVVGRGERAPEGVVNLEEAAYAVDLVEALVRDGVAPADVAVLTPFVGQCVRIEQELGARGLVQRRGVLVSTVHRLQGGERRVVVFSVTATAPRHLRWLAARPHLLHVATSRAQDHLVVLVDPSAADREPALAPLRDALTAGPRYA